MEENITQDNKIDDADIKASFILTKEDIRDALRISGKLNKDRVRSIVLTVLLIVGLSLYIYKICEGLGTGFDYFISVLCLFLMAAVWISPRRRDSKFINKSADGREMFVGLTADYLRLSIPGSGTKSKIELHGGGKIITQSDSIYLISAPRGSMFILPKRAFTIEQRQDVERILFGCAEDRQT